MTALTLGGRRCVDLGRLDPRCGARYHGTYIAYIRAGCRCPHAREAHRLYQKRSREGRNEPVMLDATGTRRRIQGMWALGHPSRVIAAECRDGFDPASIVRFCRLDKITPVSRDLVSGAYRTLITRPGASKRTRSRALASGFALPVQWGADIDEPGAVPEPLEPVASDGDLIDEIAVERALAGERLELTDPELVAVLQAGVARGEPLSRLAEHLGLNYWGARKMLGGDTPRREKQARVEAEILRSSADDYVIAANLGVHRSTVSRARARLVASGVLVAA